METASFGYSFGHWIKRRRKSLDLTQDELARRLGCSPSLIYKIETDERRPSRQVAELLAELLEIPSDQRLLFLKIARQEKATDRLEDIQPLTGLEHPPSPKVSLPRYPTPFIGREHEIDIIIKQLLEPACRLLTLTGPGGMGKTRLAVEVARRLEGKFSGGIYFLAMAAVSQADALPSLADALGVFFSGPADPVLQLIHFLREKEILLVLDNTEHLIAGCTLLEEILQQAPRVKLLLTSREQANLQWEWIFDVQGLPVPEEANAATLEANSAVALFLQRARQAAYDFESHPEDSEALMRICKAAGGLPLAIELAASWVHAMSLKEIANEMERGLSWLETNLRDVPLRHRSLRMVFDYSWKLLSDSERRVLMRLSVFAGGFNRQAAEAVVGATLASLSSLVKKSLLRHNKNADRYDFHESVHHYAQEKLHENPAEETQVYEQYSEYYSHWLASQEAPLKSAQQVCTSALIHSEKANWLSAWLWGAENCKLKLLRRMMPCLYWYFEIHGVYAKAFATFQQAADILRCCGAPGNLATPEERSAFAFLLDQLGWFQFRTGKIEPAEALFAESLELAREYGDPEVLFHIYGNWGYMELLHGAADQAVRLTLECLSNAQTLSSPWHIAIPMNVMGIVELQRGNLEVAYQQLTKSLDAWRKVGDLRGLVFCMLFLSSTEFGLGHLASAEALLKESHTIAVEKSDIWAQAFGLDLLGQVASAQGQSQQAFQHFQQSLALSEEIGDQWGRTLALIHDAEAHAAVEFNAETERLFMEAFRDAQQGCWEPVISEVLVAYLCANQDLSIDRKLAATLSVLAVKATAISPHIRLRGEHLKESLISELEPGQLEQIETISQTKSPELWAWEIFNS